MRNFLTTSAFALLTVAFPTVGALAQTAPRVTTPPESAFALIDSDDRELARKFYTKYIDVKGMPVLASAVVADEALERTYSMVTHVLAGRPDVIAAMVKNGMYLIIIGRQQVYTDMPEYRHSRNPAYQNERVRGTGGKPTSFGEENVLCLSIDRYDDESIGVHEFCHTIDSTLASIDPTWRERKNKAFRDATGKGLWKNTYAGSNPGEFWAEVAQSYFDCNRVNNWNHGPIGTREQLKAYDPETYELVRSAFQLSPEQDWRYSWVQKLPNVTAPPPQFKIAPYYTKFTWAREFPIVGRGASDAALLKANDTVRKMFAYRHDILKALINDGVKMVVLGPNEKVADLPEYQTLKNIEGFDALTRLVTYSPQGKLLVVGEENVLGVTSEPMVGDNQVIRAMADAFYQITSTRPVDPNWDKRGQDVQQYELRVKRLDVTFGQKVDEIYQAAQTKALWQGTSAMASKANYWTKGVLAYFDATGQDSTPVGGTGAISPIRTREDLQRYDTALYALVHETMAYEGKVDWHYKPYMAP
ncbi:hypothetical protein EON83_04905 [bacterium]|nr:MAG: hypothetical protein EON83_04905 [bacterium]